MESVSPSNQDKEQSDGERRRSPLPDSGDAQDAQDNSGSGSRIDYHKVLGLDPAEPLIAHLLIAAFHHRKGNVIEFWHHSESDAEANELIEEGISNLPDCWSQLAFAMLPDRVSEGQEYHELNVIYLTLPDPDDPKRTLYASAVCGCVGVDRVLNRSEAMTRNVIQKSIALVSRIPLFGYLADKLRSVAYVYFKELDLNNMKIFKETFHDLSSGLSLDIALDQQFHGLAICDHVVRYAEKILILIKLTLLGKRVLIFGSRPDQVSSLVVTLCALLSGTLDLGGLQSSCPQIKYKPDFQVVLEELDQEKAQLAKEEEERRAREKEERKTREAAAQDQESQPINGDQIVCYSKATDTVVVEDPLGLLKPPPSPESQLLATTNDRSNDTSAESLTETCDTQIDGCVVSCLESSSEEPAKVVTKDNRPSQRISYGLPLELFGVSTFCWPFITLGDVSLLDDERISGYLMGSSNPVFSKICHDKHHAIFYLDKGRLDLIDHKLTKLSNLTTEDRRFMQYLSQQISANDGTQWEGGEEWVRVNFRQYLLYLMRTSVGGEQKLVSLVGGASAAGTVTSQIDPLVTTLVSGSGGSGTGFNSYFMEAFKKTRAYRRWLKNPAHEAIYDLTPGHPFSGPVRMTDVSNAFAYSQRGRKLAATSKAVFSTAKNIWSSWYVTTGPSPQQGTASKDQTQDSASNPSDQDPQQQHECDPDNTENSESTICNLKHSSKTAHSDDSSDSHLTKHNTQTADKEFDSQQNQKVNS